MTPTVFGLIVFSACIHASWNLAAKKAAGNFYVIYLSLPIGCLFSFPFLLMLSPTEIFNEKAFPYVFATGTIHAVYFWALAKAYEHGDISSAYPVARGTGVAGTAVAAWALLHENIILCGMLGILAISIGTIFVGMNRSGKPGQLKGVLFALLVGMTITAYCIVDKLGVGVMHPVAYIHGLFWVAALWLTPYVFLLKRRELAAAWRQYKSMSFVIGIVSMGNYLLILFIYRLAPVSYVVALRELAVAIGALMGYLFLREKFTAVKIAGIALIVIGMIAIKIS